MKKPIAVLLSLFLLVSFAGCAYVDVRLPYDLNLDRTDLGTKVGTASTYSVLWLVAWGDASYAAAAADGGITVMKHADQQMKQVLFGAYVKRTVIVYGD